MNGSVRLFICLLPFSYVPIIAPSWNFQFLQMTEVASMQNLMVKGQDHIGQNPT